MNFGFNQGAKICVVHSIINVLATKKKIKRRFFYHARYFGIKSNIEYETNHKSQLKYENQKELKAAYKQQPTQMGVLQVRNEVNGKVLIEGATNIPAKWNRHQTELRFGSHRNQQLQNDWNSMGAEHFTFSVISELEANEEDKLDVNKEIKLLCEMVLEEMGIDAEAKY